MESVKKTTKKAARTHAKVAHPHGTLIIIGGKEDKSGEMKILKEIARRLENGKLVIITAASEIPSEVWNDYEKVFKKLKVHNLEHLHVNQPDDVEKVNLEKVFHNAKGIFFTGGDQLKLTSKLGGTVVMDYIIEVFRAGGVLAGTSAGAAVMGETMLVGGENGESHKVGNWMMAPGLRFVENMIIDQHFAQRGRIGRLLGAVALNPGILGIGIDEGTAIVIEENKFKILGDNAVYVLDGREVTYTNISEASADQTMSIHDVKLHVLSEPEVFDLKARTALT
ncbi:cyanophycinase [Bdellovibrio sp. BCCA]|uniref:cyanophycinase n=1 Tax=unclassified Bdellovibrio TaxID=2633795 RepID=UPI0025E2A00D|nr:cyanophycinase [uncultured Bdellovibrio sp.]